MNSKNQNFGRIFGYALSQEILKLEIDIEQLQSYSKTYFYTDVKYFFLMEKCVKKCQKRTKTNQRFGR